MLSIDVGFGNTKIFNGKKLSAFPSVYYRRKPNEGQPDYSRDTVIELDGDSYYVGMSAFKKGGSSPFEKRNMFRHKLFVLTAICSVTKGDFEDKVVLGLPIVDYESMAPELEALAGEYDVVFNEEKRHINITEISVYRQGEAVFKYLQKQDKAVDKQVVAIVDVGQKTVDVAWFDDGYYDYDKSGSFSNLGCMSAYVDIAKALSAIDYPVEPINVRKYLSKVPAESEKAFEFMSNAILEKLGNLEWNYNILDRIVLVGGGASFIKKYMPAQEKVEVMDNGAYANVRSFYECEA